MHFLKKLVGKRQKMAEQIQVAFADFPASVGFKLENARDYPEACGNQETMDFAFGKLRARLAYDRGELWFDVLIPSQPKKTIGLSALMERYGFSAKSSEVVVNLHGFFKSEQNRLLALGESLTEGEVPVDIADLLPSDDPNENLQRMVAALDKSLRQKAGKS